MPDIKVHNKSDKPNNVVLKENQIIEKCLEIQNQMPRFLRDYFLYLKNAIAINSRLAYLTDLQFFLRYMVEESDLTDAKVMADITLEDFNRIKARDVNRFLGDYCTRYLVETKHTKFIMENHNRALSRKKSSLSVLFKFLFRDELIDKNITDGFNPIKLPKPQPDAIKKLAIDEVATLFDAVENGSGLTKKELQYWEKTKLRDKAILMLFVTYGLRLSELQQLNLDSFNYSRGEFRIYRKRGKEVDMPINQSVEKVLKEYIKIERGTCLDDDDPLFLSLQNKRMTVKSIRQLVKKYTSIALGTSRDKGYSPHKLRATAASSLIEYGFSIYDVQSLLDHDNVTTTQLYAAHRKNVKREIVSNYELLDEFDKNNK